MTTYRERHLSGLYDAGTEATPQPQAEANLDDMTKDELLAYAKERDISPANAAMTKDEIRESIDNA